MNIKKSILLMFFLFGVTAFKNAEAHLYWVEPNEFYFYNKSKQIDKKVSEVLTFEFTGGDTYFNADTNRAKDNEKLYTFSITDKNNNTVTIDDMWQGKTRAVFEANINTPGTYILGVARIHKPMYYTKLKNGEYINKSADELTDNEIENSVKSVGYYQFAKSYTTLHTPNEAWKITLDNKLEIIPLSHPNLIYEGDELKVKIIFDGKPLPNTKIKAINQNYRFKEHGETPLSNITDQNGITSFRFSKANRYLITTSHNVDLKENKKADALNYSASLMLQVNELRIKKWVNYLRN